MRGSLAVILRPSAMMSLALPQRRPKDPLDIRQGVLRRRERIGEYATMRSRLRMTFRSVILRPSPKMSLALPRPRPKDPLDFRQGVLRRRERIGEYATMRSRLRMTFRSVILRPPTMMSLALPQPRPKDPLDNRQGVLRRRERIGEHATTRSRLRMTFERGKRHS